MWRNGRMWKAIRVGALLLVLFVVLVNTWLTQARSTDWDNSLWVKIYPINADGSSVTDRYIDSLRLRHFEEIEKFVAREATRYGKNVPRPVRIELGSQVHEQPPALPDEPNVLAVMLWSLKMRLWVNDATDGQDKIEPDVSIFVRYHQADQIYTLENSIGVQKGMYGIVNGYTGRRYSGTNNVIIAHEFLHTLGASDKYDAATGLPLAPHGLADPEQSPLYPQRRAEIMGGRIAESEHNADIPKNLGFAIIGPMTASEIGLTD